MVSGHMGEDHVQHKGDDAHGYDGFEKIFLSQIRVAQDDHRDVEQHGQRSDGQGGKEVVRQDGEARDSARGEVRIYGKGVYARAEQRCARNVRQQILAPLYAKRFFRFFHGLFPLRPNDSLYNTMAVFIWQDTI